MAMTQSLRSRVSKFLAILSLQLVGVLPAMPAMAREAVFLTLEYAPYASESVRGDGAIIQVLREALAGTEWQVKIRYVPWARVPLEVRSNQIAGALPVWSSEAKSFGLLAGHPVFESRLGFFVRKSDWATIDTRLAHMAGKKVCTARGYGYPDSLAAAGVIRDDANSDEANLKRITLGRCDYVAVERAVGEYLLSRNKPWALQAEVAWKEPAFAVLPLFIGIAPQFPDADRLRAAVEQGVERMRKSGRLKAIADGFSIDIPSVVSAR
jgi:polar amino acid transport system substrate-binding protein